MQNKIKINFDLRYKISILTSSDRTLSADLLWITLPVCWFSRKWRVISLVTDTRRNIDNLPVSHIRTFFWSRTDFVAGFGCQQNLDNTVDSRFCHSDSHLPSDYGRRRTIARSKASIITGHRTALISWRRSQRKLTICSIGRTLRYFLFARVSQTGRQIKLTLVVYNMLLVGTNSIIMTS